MLMVRLELAIDRRTDQTMVCVVRKDEGRTGGWFGSGGLSFFLFRASDAMR